MSLAPSSLPLLTQDAAPYITRPSANFPPSFWGDTFLHYHSDSLVLFFIFAFAIFYFYLLTFLLFISLFNLMIIGLV